MSDDQPRSVSAGDNASIAPAHQAPEQALVTWGDVAVSRSWVVTPNGSASLPGTEFDIMDFSREESRIPAWAIVMTVLLFWFFFLSLLFLLVRTTVVSGHVQVVVRNEKMYHLTNVPVTTRDAVVDLYGRVNYARKLAAEAAMR